MPLNATFVADFSSFLTATRQSVDATKELTGAAQGVGPVFDAMAAQGAKASEEANNAAKEEQARALEFGRALGENIKELGSVAGEFAMKYIDAYKEAGTATTRLSVALKNAGQDAVTAKAYEEIADQLQKVSTYSKVAIENTMTLFTAVGQVKPDNMEATLKATMDLAAGMGIDLPAASKLMIKAAESDGDALGKLKLILGDTITKGMTFADVIEAINQKFGGQSQAALATTTGHLENMKNQMDEINERIGKVFATTMNTLLDAFKKLPQPIQDTTLSLWSLLDASSNVIQSLESLIALLSLPMAGKFRAGIVSGFEAILPWIVPGGFIAVALYALYALIFHFDDVVAAEKKSFDEYVNGWKLVGAIFQVVATKAAGAYLEIKNWMYDQLIIVFQKAEAFIDASLHRMVASFQWMYDELIGHSIIPDLMEGVGVYFSQFDRLMVDPVTGAVKKVNDALAALTLEQLPALGAWGTGGVSAQTSLDASGVAAQARLSPFGAGSSTFGIGPQVPDVNMTINMQGMWGTDDPQTRAALNDVISGALMQGMRNTRLMGTS